MFAKATARPSTVREVEDVRALRALAHPFRVRLYELVGREGTLTATEASALTGESTASCSFHLRQLGKYGFLEQVGSAEGRERHWQRTSAANSFRGDGSSEFAAAEEAAVILFAQQLSGQLRDFVANRGTLAAEWRDVSFLSDALMYLTVDELAELKRNMLALTAQYRERLLDVSRRPNGAKPVAVFASGFPVAPTPSGN
jgi:hypothetical protein